MWGAGFPNAWDRPAKNEVPCQVSSIDKPVKQVACGNEFALALLGRHSISRSESNDNDTTGVPAPVQRTIVQDMAKILFSTDFRFGLIQFEQSVTDPILHQ